jgi:hypothetical protein
MMIFLIAPSPILTRIRQHISVWDNCNVRDVESSTAISILNVRFCRILFSIHSPQTSLFISDNYLIFRSVRMPLELLMILPTIVTDVSKFTNGMARIGISAAIPALMLVYLLVE